MPRRFISDGGSPVTNSDIQFGAEVEVSDPEMETGGWIARNFPDVRVSAAGPETGNAPNAAAIGVIRAGKWRFGVFGKWTGTAGWVRTADLRIHNPAL